MTESLRVANVCDLFCSMDNLVAWVDDSEITYHKQEKGWNNEI